MCGSPVQTGSGAGPITWPATVNGITTLSYGNGRTAVQVAITNYIDGTGLRPAAWTGVGAPTRISLSDTAKPTKDEIGVQTQSGGTPAIFVLGFMGAHTVSLLRAHSAQLPQPPGCLTVLLFLVRAVIVGVGLGQKFGAFASLTEQTGDVAFHTAAH